MLCIITPVTWTHNMSLGFRDHFFTSHNSITSYMHYVQILTKSMCYNATLIFCILDYTLYVKIKKGPRRVLGGM